MTLKEAKITIYANVVYACEMAGFPPMTIKLVKDACDTVIALAEQADTPQTDCEDCDKYDTCPNADKGIPQTDCGWGKPTTVGSDEDKED